MIDSSRRVEISFEYTLAELREGVRPPEFSRGRSTARWLRLTATLAFLILAVAFFIFLHASQQSGPAGASTAPPARSAPALYLALVPSWCAAAIYIVLALSALLRARLYPKTSTRKWSRLPPLAAGLVAGAIVLLAMNQFGALDETAEIALSGQAIVGLSVAPWVVLLVVLIVMGKRAARRKLVKRPALHRRRTMALDDEIGLISADELANAQYRWKYFQQAWETPNVLTLVDENRQAHILPKRAFASPADLQLARSLVVTHIPDNKMLVKPTGFEVAPPAANPTPLPVIPIPEPAGGNSEH